MNRIQERFRALRQGGRPALVPFITAGDPEPAATVELMHELVRAGADLIELGVPFTDPMADGPVIQHASERALAHGVSLRDVLGMVAEFRSSDPETPVILMGYLNPVEAMGYAEYARRAAEAGVDGSLVVDMPPEEAGDFLEACRERGLETIFLVAPTTAEERMDLICRAAGGFVYYVSLKGVTGSDQLDVSVLGEKLGQIRRHTDVPVGIGFGIKDAATAAAVGRLADAVVVGSALVSRIEAHGADRERLRREVHGFIGELRQALDRE
ncbi:MAG: tryptophan synthase subunit alpha [Gammaproteobacteria bacterium]|nr:MAG: tryptophan synthase subunit alpha [Gammaproteobacteria bacterium]